jgi:hypothetical protein
MEPRPALGSGGFGIACCTIRRILQEELPHDTKTTSEVNARTQVCMVWVSWRSWIHNARRQSSEGWCGI